MERLRVLTSIEGAVILSNRGFNFDYQIKNTSRPADSRAEAVHFIHGAEIARRVPGPKGTPNQDRK